MAVTIDFTKTSQEILVDLINGSQSPETTLTTADVTFSSASENETTPETIGDTKVTVTGVLVEGYKGSVEVTYNRVDITVVPGANSKVFEVGSATNVSDLLADINTRFGINLTAGDIVDAALPTITSGPENFNLEITTGSLVYSGTVVLQVTSNAEELNTVIETTALDGLDWT